MAGMEMLSNPMLMEKYEPQKQWSGHQEDFDPFGRPVPRGSDYQDRFPDFGPIQSSAPKYRGVGELTSAIHRNQWDDYRKRFQKYEDALINSVGNHGDELRAAGDEVSKQFDVSGNEYNRMRRGYGLSMGGNDQKSNARQRKIQEASAKVGAINNTRQHLRERDLATLSGGL